MRLIILVLVLSCATVSRAAESFSVLSAPARIAYFNGDIRVVCGASANGCTEIIGVSLHATCEEEQGQWRPRAAVTFVPYVHLPAFAGPHETTRILEHELAHVRDFHEGAETYVRGLSGRRFESAEACRAVVVEEEMVFPTFLARIGQMSQRVRR